MNIWRYYQTSMKRRPLATNMCTAFGVMLVGDVTAQKWKGDRSNLDKVRLITMLSWNSLCFTPFFFFFFRTADRIFPGRALRNVLSKVIVTQALVTIPINVAAISFKTATELSLNSFFEKTIEPLKAETILSEIKERIDVDLATLFVSSACFWSPVNFVNFRYFPTKYRVIPTIFGGIVWNTYMSFTIHEEL